MATKRGNNDTTAMPPPDMPDAPPAPAIHELDDAEEGWQGSRIEQFTDARGNPGAAVATPGEAKTPGSPELIASLAIYREPDGRLSLVREHVPQAFYTGAEDLLAEVKAELHARFATLMQE